MKIALVTITIGDLYIQQHQHIFAKSQQNYAERHGYEYRTITDFMGPIRRSALICLEKQLICSQPWAASYDYILYIDADILIHPEAPPIHSFAESTEQICMVNEMNQPTREERRALHVRYGWESKVSDYYSLCGLDFDTDIIYNGGVILWQPKLHAEFCLNIYKKYAIAQINHPRWYHYEQAVVNYEYQKANICKSVPHKWNAIWALHTDTTFTGTLEEFIQQNYFIHLAGHRDYEAAMRWSRRTFASAETPATSEPAPTE